MAGLTKKQLKRLRRDYPDTKEWRVAYTRLWTKMNPLRVREHRELYYEQMVGTDKDRKAYNKKFTDRRAGLSDEERIEQKEKMRLYMIKYRADKENYQRIKDANKKWYYNNKDKVLAIGRAYYKRKKEE